MAEHALPCTIDVSYGPFRTKRCIGLTCIIRMLFFRFFTRSYRTRAAQQSASKRLQQSGNDATADVKEEMKDSTALGNGNEDMDPPNDIKAKLAAAKERVKSAESALGEKASAISSKAGELFEEGKDRLNKAITGDADGRVDPNDDQTGEKSEPVEARSHPVKTSEDHVKQDTDDTEQPKVSDPDQQEDLLDEQKDDQIKIEESEHPLLENTDESRLEDDDESKQQSEDDVKDANTTDIKEEDVDSSLVDLGDAQAYEATIDEVKDGADDQAEKELQPEGV